MYLAGVDKMRNFTLNITNCSVLSQILLIILKIVNLLELSWWWIMLPTVSFLILFLILYIIVLLIDK